MENKLLIWMHFFAVIYVLKNTGQGRLLEMKIEIRLTEEEYKSLLDNQYGGEEYFIEEIAEKLQIDKTRVKVVK